MAILSKLPSFGSILNNIALKLKNIKSTRIMRFGSILNNIALKLCGHVKFTVKCFGSILNNIALKHVIQYDEMGYRFGSILNNIALKPRKKIQGFVIALLVHSKTSVRVLQQLFFLIISWENKPVGNKT